MRPMAAKEKNSIPQLFRQLWPFVRPYRLRFAGGMLALVVTTLALMSVPQVARIMVDRAIAAGDTALLNQSIICIMGLVVIMVVGILLRTLLLRYTTDCVIADLRRHVYNHALSLSAGFYESQRIGDVLSRLLSDITVLRETIGTELPFLLRGLMLLTIGTTFLFYTSLKLTLILCAVIPVLWGASVFLGRPMRRLARVLQDKFAAASAQIEESLNAVRTVQAFAQEEREKERFANLIEQTKRTAFKRMLTVSGFFGFNVFAGFTALSCVVWVGGYDVIHGSMSAGELVAYFFYVALLGDAASNISNFWPSLQMAAGAGERVFEVMDHTPQVDEPAAPKALPTTTAGRALAFKNVTFSYPAHPDRPTLHDLSFEVKPGETVALVGPSGAGKSTLFSLLLRFYDPQKGTVELDGVDIKSLALNNLRTAMALVPQEAVMFSTTVGENIRYGCPGATPEQVAAAAQVAHASDFIESLPEGYNTMVGEKGVRLSGGQRQRLAIARAVLCNPSVLLLDEATSHLDAESESYVQKAFGDIMQNRTTLVIAHRLATVQMADRILVMDKGKLIAAGKHDELVENNELYRRLAQLQFLA